MTPHSAVTPICPSPIVFQPSEFIFHISYFILLSLRSRAIKCLLSPGFPRTSFSRCQNPLHCTRPPSPPKGDVATRPEPALHRSTLRASYGCFATALGARVSASVPERAFYLGSPLIPQHHGARIHRAIMFRLPRSELRSAAVGADSLGLPAVAGNTPWGGIG